MTEKGIDGYYIPASRGTFCVQVDEFRKIEGTRFTGTVVDRLGKYEECGLDPEEVQQMAHDWTKYETAMSYVDELGGIEALKCMVMEGKR